MTDMLDTVNPILFNGSQPISALPVEILGEIFVKYLEDGKFTYERSRWPIRVSTCCPSSPFLLGQICSQWRRLANSMPSLWSRFQINEPQDMDLELLAVWLERSRQHELAIDFVSRQVDDLSALYSAFVLLAQHSARWSHVNICIASPALPIIRHILNAANIPAKLKSVSLSLWGGVETTDNFYPDVCEFLFSSPSLKQVVWNDHESISAPRNIPFQSILHMEFKVEMGIETLLAILSRCSSLQTLKIRSLVPQHRNTTSAIQMVSLPHLRHMSLTATTPTESLFSRLSTPSLEILDVQQELTTSAPDAPTVLKEFLLRSNCNLTKLTVFDPHPRDEQWGTCLAIRPLSRLLDLTIMGPVSTPLLQHLSQSASGTPKLLPNLRKLHLVCCRDIVDGTLSKLVQARWPTTDEHTISKKMKGDFVFAPDYDSLFGPIDKAFLARQGIDVDSAFRRRSQKIRYNLF